MHGQSPLSPVRAASKHFACGICDGVLLRWWELPRGMRTSEGRASIGMSAGLPATPTVSEPGVPPTMLDRAMVVLPDSRPLLHPRRQPLVKALEHVGCDCRDRRERIAPFGAGNENPRPLAHIDPSG